jgi:hypothetical protein
MLSMNDQDRRQQARTVITDAQSGSLSLEDFHRRWPDVGDPLLDAIFDETEDTLEHTEVAQSGSLPRVSERANRARLPAGQTYYEADTTPAA